MEKTLLCVLLLLLLPAGGASATAQRQLCRPWTPEVKAPEEGLFLCPGEHHPPEDRFCCGTCKVPYCCSSKENQLDQRRCHFEVLGYTVAPAQHAWHFLSFFLGVITLALFFVVGARILSTQLWSYLTRPCCCEQRQEVRLEEMDSPPTLSVLDMPLSSACVSLGTASLGGEAHDDTAGLSPAGDNAPLQVFWARHGIPEDKEVPLNTNISSPALEAALQIEDLPCGQPETYIQKCL